MNLSTTGVCHVPERLSDADIPLIDALCSVDWIPIPTALSVGLPLGCLPLWVLDGAPR